MRQRPSALTDGARPLIPEILIVAKRPKDARSRGRRATDGKPKAGEKPAAGKKAAAEKKATMTESLPIVAAPPAAVVPTATDGPIAAVVSTAAEARGAAEAPGTVDEPRAVEHAAPVVKPAAVATSAAAERSATAEKPPADKHTPATLKGQRARKPVPTKSRGGVTEGIKSVLWAVLLFFVIRTFAITAYSIPSESMEESLLIGDYLMANNALFGATIPFTSIKLPSIRDPNPGEIVVFRPGYNEPRIDVVKRVIGVPGDTLQMRDKVIYRNGKRLDEPYARYLEEGDVPIAEFGTGMMMDPTVRTDAYGSHNHYPLLVSSVDKRAYRPSSNNWGPLVVPPGKYWLMGDNRDRSLDSRFMGPVPRVDIRGKPLFIYFSYDKTDPYAAFPRPITAARWDRFFHRVR